MEQSSDLGYKVAIESRRDRLRMIGAAANYATSPLGALEIQGEKGSSGPPAVPGEPGGSEAERQEFRGDLTPTSLDVWM